MSRTIWDVIKSPLITEKSLTAKERTEEGKQILTFRVDRQATKPEIKLAVEQIFNVKVGQVRTLNFDGKIKRQGRFAGRRPAWKKAIVTLQAGQEAFDYGEAI